MKDDDEDGELAKAMFASLEDVGGDGELAKAIAASLDDERGRSHIHEGDEKCDGSSNENNEKCDGNNNNSALFQWVVERTCAQLASRTDPINAAPAQDPASPPATRAQRRAAAQRARRRARREALDGARLPDQVFFPVLPLRGAAFSGFH